MSPRSALLLVAVVTLSAGLLAAACSSSATGLPGPGSTPPGQACTTARDCGCWTCLCTGVGGEPGSAQLCLSGECPTGEAACAPSCAAAGTTVASATAMSTCVGVP